MEVDELVAAVVLFDVPDEVVGDVLVVDESFAEVVEVTEVVGGGFSVEVVVGLAELDVDADVVVEGVDDDVKDVVVIVDVTKVVVVFPSSSSKISS